MGSRPPGARVCSFLSFAFGCAGASLLRGGFLQLLRAGPPLRCGAQDQSLWDTGLVAPRMWGNLPAPGIEPMSLALASGFLTTGPPGKSPESMF